MRIEDDQGHTRGHEGHDPGRPDVPSHPSPKFDPEHPGYETQDVNVSGIAYFLGGLMASIFVFFLLCFYIGKAINYSFVREDGTPDKWHPYGQTHNAHRDDLTPNPVTLQKDLAAIKDTFPTPRLVADDDNHETYELHAREDLLLDNYSSDTQGGTTTMRIPIDRAMELIAQRGLGAAPVAQAKTLMAGEHEVKVSAPLTTGFARTGYELDQIETRKQQNVYEQAKKKE